jgi:hypothetical protein
LKRLALLIYLLLAVAIFSSTWVNPAGSWIGSPKDPQLFIWYLGWIPNHLSLFTDYLSYPDGVNLMWNTSMIFPALILWPVTALFGPVVAYNVLMTVGIALSAWFGFLAAERFIDRPIPCFAAGLVYGFSPALIAQALGHPHVMVALFPPIALILGHEILVRHRMHPAAPGALAGAASAAQLLTGEELLAMTLLIAAIGAALVRPPLPYVAKAAAAALAVFAVLAAYPLWFQFFGPQRASGSLQPPDVYVSDLVAFVLPSNLIHFTGNRTENDAYVGLPLLALFVAGLVMGWRRPAIRWLGSMTLIVAVLSLGPHLHVNGNVTPIPLPWAAVAHLPLMESALPSRLMAIGFLGVGIIAATTLQVRRVVTTSALVAGLAIVTVPWLPYPSQPAAAPAFFRPGGGVERIAPGQVVLVTPFSSKVSTDAMYWQATANYLFRMPEGDAFTPGPYLGPHPSIMQSILDDLDAGQSVTVTPEVLDLFRADLEGHGITAIVAGPSAGQPAIVEFLTEVEGSPPADDGGVKVWWNTG